MMGFPAQVGTFSELCKDVHAALPCEGRPTLKKHDGKCRELGKRHPAFVRGATAGNC